MGFHVQQVYPKTSITFGSAYNLVIDCNGFSQESISPLSARIEHSRVNLAISLFS